MGKSEQAPVYSYLGVLPSSRITSSLKKELSAFLFSGIKVLLLTDKDVSFTDVMSEEEEKAFKDKYLLQTFMPDSPEFQIKDHFIIIDGEEVPDEIYDVAEHFLSFNLEQYLIEHAPADEHLSVKAGAGTGKTTVMVQRVMYLLQKAGVSPKEIAMITFTRDAAQEMFHRLRQELFNRYQLTRQVRYLQYIEELKKMRISTIHSFAKMLLKEMGAALGYGRNVQIRTFKNERKRIIEAELEKYLLKMQDEEQKSLAELISPLRLHELIDTLNSFWEEMEKKGMTIDEIASLEWGEATDEHAFYNTMMKTIFQAVEREFQQFKQTNNAVSLNDLTRQVDLALRKQKKKEENPFEKLPSPFRYIFVDEFQDSDDVQIRLISQMQKALNASLFVVGDIKQSIYRFRGADHTAFNRLQEEMQKNGQKLKQYSLRKNYRTVKTVLENMHPYFLEWGKKGWLQYSDVNREETDKLIGIRNMPKGLPPSKLIYPINKPKEELEDDVISMIKKAKQSVQLDQESKPGKRKIAVLVRTNKEAKLVERWCDKHGIDTYLNVGGTFFTSHAVVHFAMLVEALLYPKRVSSIVNLLNTPYSSKGIDWTALAKFNGDEEKIYDFLKESVLGSYESGFPLLEVSRQLRIRPVFSVLRKIIISAKPASRYYLQEKERIYLHLLRENNGMSEKEAAEKAEERAKLKWRQYVKNLNHLMDLLHEQFDSDFATLYSIHSWLKRNQAANRDEDEPRIEEVPEDVVHIMTVHRSKGLEFHTVMIPFTERPFRYNFSEVLFDEHKKQVGWKIRKQDQVKENLNYARLSKEEDAAVLQEETRLLYVAMTRCQNQLWIIKNEYSKGPSVWNWTKLLSVRT